MPITTACEYEEFNSAVHMPTISGTVWNQQKGGQRHRNLSKAVNAAVTKATVSENGLVYSQPRSAPKSQREIPQTSAAKTIVEEMEIRVNMHHDQTIKRQDLIALLQRVHLRGLPCYPLLAVFFTGAGEPPDCLPMLRSPAPKTGFIFAEDFRDHLRDAMVINEGVHDGAVAFRRSTIAELYKCLGWSYRIVAKRKVRAAEPNRGAAYNSAISLSLTPAVDCVCLFSRNELEVFSVGERLTLQS